jgi:hypothetical protein
MTSRRTSSRRRRVLLTAAGSVAVLSLGFGTGEAVARHLVHNRIADALDGRLGTGPDVSLGLRPALLAVLDSTLPSVTVSGHAEAAGFPGVPVTVRLTDVTTDRDRRTTTVSGSHVTAEVTTAAIAQKLTPAGGQGVSMVSAVTTDPAAGTVNLAVQGGLAAIQVRPTVTDGKLTMPVTGGQLLGSQAPPAMLNRVQTAVDDLPLSNGPERRSGATAALGLQLKEVTVVGDGLRIDLAGPHAELGRAAG